MKRLETGAESSENPDMRTQKSRGVNQQMLVNSLETRRQKFTSISDTEMLISLSL